MKKLLCVAVAFLCLCFFGCKKDGPDAGKLAGIAAKGYYDLLLEGKYEDFIAGTNTPNRISQNYQQQLLLNAKMFVEQQQEEHNGMKKVEVLSAKADTSQHVADVFLSITYGDSTKEQVNVPMVEVNGIWKMR